MLRTFVAVVAVAFAAMVLSPFKLSILHMLTGNVYVNTDCGPPTAPTLKLRHVRECGKVPDRSKEPCVVRNAFSESAIESFFAENGDYPFTLKRITDQESMLGNPLSESYNHVGTDDKLKCSMNNLMRKDERCAGYYTGFKSLNFSNYLAFNNSNFNIEQFVRTDLFLGYLTSDKVTATFHSNSFEKSQTVQLVGEKVWLLMRPEDYFSVFQAYALGAYNAAYNLCSKDLEKVEILTVHTHPGDILIFPKAWAHHIYTRAGPNIMITFRRDEIHPWKLRDLVAVATQIVGGVRGVVKARLLGEKVSYISEDHCDPATRAPTSFGRGHPHPSFAHKGHYNTDMRCGELFNPYTKAYKERVTKEHQHSSEVDESIYNQIFEFLGDSRSAAPK